MTDRKLDDINVIHTPPVTDEEGAAAVARALRGYLDTGVIPEGFHVEDYATFSARGRVADCDCGMIQCVCTQARQHKKECKFRRALTCPVAIECDHGNDVCATCDVCDCGGIST
jgi:hypothetical protein